MASNGGYYFKYRKYNSRCIKADWYCYCREDGLKALICLPEIMDITTYAKLQILWVPPGMAHGFYTLSDTAEFQYKCTDYYYPQDQETLMWNSVDIEWPLDGDPVLSLKDMRGYFFEECTKYD